MWQTAADLSERQLADWIRDTLTLEAAKKINSSLPDSK
jgi:hypothetical protein